MDWVFNKSIALKHFFKYKGVYYSVLVNFAHDCIYIYKTVKKTQNENDCYKPIEGIGVKRTIETIEVGNKLYRYIEGYKNKYNPENQTFYFHKNYSTYTLESFAQYCVREKMRVKRLYCQYCYPYDSTALCYIGFTKTEWDIVAPLFYEAYVSAYELMIKKICESTVKHRKRVCRC